MYYSIFFIKNILINRNGHIKITDFGFAKQLGVEDR